jgi:Glyoxalase/Bleomycin resistance protein/Dioxygenase superfamily
MKLEPYHTGIVVEDIATAVPAWQEATGMPWGAVYDGPLAVRTAATDTIEVVEMKLAYSSDLRIELVERRPGTCWTVEGGDGVHHTGCWSENLEAEAKELEGLGWPIVAHGIGEHGGFAVFSYHQVPGVGLLELVSVDARAMVEAMANGA